jgi:hypothetical protein
MALPWKGAKKLEEFPYSIVMPWPTLPRYEFTDPNAVWRDYMEENVGRQYFQWDWGMQFPNHVRIFFEDEISAMQFKLTWL